MTAGTRFYSISIMAFHFKPVVIENAFLLTVLLIDAVLLSILLLIRLRTLSSAVASYVLAVTVLIVLVFLFLQDQWLLDTIEPGIETFRRVQRPKA